jgi:hypothetical protein
LLWRSWTKSLTSIILNISCALGYSNTRLVTAAQFSLPVCDTKREACDRVARWDNLLVNIKLSVTLSHFIYSSCSRSNEEWTEKAGLIN